MSLGERVKSVALTLGCSLTDFAVLQLKLEAMWKVNTDGEFNAIISQRWTIERSS
jgi:hypothetical protein